MLTRLICTLKPFTNDPSSLDGERGQISRARRITFADDESTRWRR